MAPDTEPALAGCAVAFSGRGLPPCSQMIGGCPSLERALALRPTAVSSWAGRSELRVVQLLSTVAN